jgi:hypothetical protein
MVYRLVMYPVALAPLAHVAFDVSNEQSKETHLLGVKSAFWATYSTLELSLQ